MEMPRASDKTQVAIVVEDKDGNKNVEKKERGGIKRFTVVQAIL